MVKNLPTMQETWVWSLGQEDTLEKGMATHSSILAWGISWTEKPGRLQSMRSERVGHDWLPLLLSDKQQGFTVQHRELYSIYWNNQNGKESEKNMYLNHCAVYLKLTQYCKFFKKSKNTILQFKNTTTTQSYGICIPNRSLVH